MAWPQDKVWTCSLRECSELLPKLSNEEREDALVFAALKHIVAFRNQQEDPVVAEILRWYGARRLDLLGWVTHLDNYTKAFQSMRRHISKPATLLAMLPPLCALTASHRHIHLMVQQGAGALALDIIKAHPRESTLVQLSCAAISNLAQHADSTLPLIAIGAHQAMANILRSSAYVDMIHASAVTALANLANTRHAAAHDALLSVDAVNLCINLLKEKGLPTTRHHASLCLANLCTAVRCHPVLLAGPALPALARACKAHPEEGPLQENAVAAAARISHEDKGEEAVRKGGFVEIAIEALSAHSDRERLRINCCALFLNAHARPNWAPELSSVFKRHRAALNACFAAAVDGDADVIIRTFVTVVGMDPDRKQQFGDEHTTPLLRAAARGRVAAVRELLHHVGQLPTATELDELVERARTAGDMSALARVAEAVQAIITDTGSRNKRERRPSFPYAAPDPLPADNAVSVITIFAHGLVSNIAGFLFFSAFFLVLGYGTQHFALD